jgi:Holliday junction resolvase
MSRESFLKRVTDVPGNTRSHKRAKVQERDLARKVGGRVTPGSGNGPIKGDVRKAGVVRIEAKTTKNKSFSVTLDMVRKIEDAALPSGEMPVIVVEFTDGSGKPIKEVAIVPTYVLGSIGEIE